jgi:hypothetical protein
VCFRCISTRQLVRSVTSARTDAKVTARNVKLDAHSVMCVSTRAQCSRETFSAAEGGNYVRALRSLFLCVSMWAAPSDAFLGSAPDVKSSRAASRQQPRRVSGSGFGWCSTAKALGTLYLMTTDTHAREPEEGCTIRDETRIDGNVLAHQPLASSSHCSDPVTLNVYYILFCTVCYSLFRLGTRRLRDRTCALDLR